MQDLDSIHRKADQAVFELDMHARIGRVQKQIDEINRRISAAVNQVGVKALELHRQGQLPVPDLSLLCQAVMDLERQVMGLQAQVAAIQQQVMPQQVLACPYCHAPVATNANFCPNCGQSLAITPACKPGPACPSCGTPAVIRAAFCGNCGFSLIAGEPQSPTSAPPTVAEAAKVTPAVLPEQVSGPTTIQPVAAAEPAMPSQPSDLRTPEPPPQVPEPLETIPSLPICPACGTQQRRPDARFCRVCGKSLAASSDAPALAPGTASIPHTGHAGSFQE